MIGDRPSLLTRKNKKWILDIGDMDIGDRPSFFISPLVENV